MVPVCGKITKEGERGCWERWNLCTGRQRGCLRRGLSTDLPEPRREDTRASREVYAEGRAARTEGAGWVGSLAHDGVEGRGRDGGSRVGGAGAVPGAR